MASIDFRTRRMGDAVALDAGAFCESELPARIAEHGQLAARGYARLGLAPLAFEVGDVRRTLRVDGDALALHEGIDADATHTVLEPRAFSELVQDVSSALGLGMRGAVELRRGSMDQFVAWEPVLRAALDGRPVYEPGMVTLRGRDGGPLELQRSFTLADPPEEIGAFLAEAGFLRIRGVFGADEMAEVSADLDAAVAEARPEEGRAWWARGGDGARYAARILGFNEKSPALTKLLRDERIARLGRFTDDAFVQRDPETEDAAEGLLKKIGVTEGISDVPWHTDCGPGMHSRRCCALTIGICLTPADRESGELGVVAGSHRANVQGGGVRRDLDLPRVALPADTGDVTVHCSCTLHMSRPPVSRERRVVYTSMALAPRPGEVFPKPERGEVRKSRAFLDDAGRRLGARGYGGHKSAEQFRLDDK
ncbi:MAG TPA: phytanoyl-CoA dioxygenase family protein [Myxococcota bacterium]|nr:phytanoyl-CoA dioxygenase family protein [Myxococcota bacterium]